MTATTELKPEPQRTRQNWNYHTYYAQQLLRSNTTLADPHHRTDHRCTHSTVTSSCNAQQRSSNDLHEQQEAVINRIHALAETVGIQVKVFRD